MKYPGEQQRETRSRHKYHNQPMPRSAFVDFFLSLCIFCTSCLCSSPTFWLTEDREMWAFLLGLTDGSIVNRSEGEPNRIVHRVVINVDPPHWAVEHTKLTHQMWCGGTDTKLTWLTRSCKLDSRKIKFCLPMQGLRRHLVRIVMRVRLIFFACHYSSVITPSPRN